MRAVSTRMERERPNARPALLDIPATGGGMGHPWHLVRCAACALAAWVGPRHGANSGGGNEPRFRPAGEVKNIVYQNRGVFDKYYLLYGLARVVYVIALTTGRRALQGFGPADMCVTPDGRHQSSNLVRTCVTSFSFLAPTPSLAVRWSSMDADGQ